MPNIVRPGIKFFGRTMVKIALGRPPEHAKDDQVDSLCP